MRKYVSARFAIAEGMDDLHESSLKEEPDLSSVEEDNIEEKITLLIQELQFMHEKKLSKRRVKELSKLILKFQKKANKKIALRTKKDTLTSQGACSDEIDRQYERMRSKTEEMEDEIHKRFEELSPKEHRKLRKKLGL